MLSNILLLILGLYAIASPFLVVFCIKFGYRMAEKPESESAKPMIPKKKKKPELSAVDKKYIDILANASIFDGTSKGQKEIK